MEMIRERKELVKLGKKEKTLLFSTSFVTFFGEVKNELKKISWTPPEEMRVYLQAVVFATFALGMSIYGIDLLTQLVLRSLSAFFQLIFG